MEEFIEIRGARVHNLKNVNVNIPRNKLVVITGVSGSGKSSLAFDTLYAEGQRRYVESLSTYARQFLERMDKPDVDHIKGISPALAIEQRTLAKNPRSTVGTVTEIYDYFRLLFARIGKTFCPDCNILVRKDTVSGIVQTIMAYPEGTKLYVLFQSSVDEKKILEFRERGFNRVIIDDEIQTFDDAAAVKKILKSKKMEILVDRLVVNEENRSRLADSVETAFNGGDGRIVIRLLDGADLNFSNKFECNQCGRIFIEPEPRLFSFNNPYGACSHCQGFGNKIEIDMDLVIPDRAKTLKQGAIKPWTTDGYADFQERLEKNAKKNNIPLDVPIKDLTKEQFQKVLNGGSGFDGIKEFFGWLDTKTYKMHVRVLLSKYRGYVTCSDCSGSRLRPDANFVKIDGRTIHDVHNMTILEAHSFFSNLKLSEMDVEIGRRALEEINKRLTYLKNVGLGYLTCSRMAGTLSGGEAQRISLATSLGSSLVGSLYILDEPSIGLHSRDNDKLIRILQNLRNIGNTVVVVEHDRDMMRQCDQIIDMGPRAGVHGGEIVSQGNIKQIIKDQQSLTGLYLSGKKGIIVPSKRRKGNGQSIQIIGAAENNLKQVDAKIPLGMFVCITGVSGSGKSTLVHDVLYAGAMRKLGMWSGKVGRHQDIKGIKNIRAVEMVDQHPIGRTPRSNPASYIKVFDAIRDVFANVPMSKLRGYKSGTFSFNVPGGRCEECEGAGEILVEMQFLADVALVCEECKGQRYKKEVLEVHYHEKNIFDVLNMTVTETIEFFKAFPKIVAKLQVLDDVGLGYLKLGQSANTLSGGEAQRVKLAAHMADRKEEHTLYILDEPTTGLHFEDINKLLISFNKLLDSGNSILVIEHNLDVIKCADYIIDLGPEGGDKGGEVIAMGTPEEIIQNERSYTGYYLKEYLK
ncbi:excinuclease ABC subunit UvrA [bacterium]|nr:excinuclease ABC subunit UvrA [bacterium]